MYAIVILMSTPEDRASALGDALVREIRVEMARHDIRSVRALAQQVGMNHSSLNDRLNKSSRTGERVEIGMEDLARICAVFGVEPWQMVRRATAAVAAVQAQKRPRSHDAAGQ